jgi:hypothetical protein
MYLNSPNMKPEEYFRTMEIINKKRYDALRAFFIEKCTAQEVAQQYGYTQSSLYSLVRDFRKFLRGDNKDDFFFKEIVLGRKENRQEDLQDLIISLRKLNFSAEDIVGIVNSKGHQISYGYVYKLLKDEGFARLPRRNAQEKKKLELPVIKAPLARRLKMEDEKFHSTSTGLLAFLPIIRQYGLDKIIDSSSYPATKEINKMSSILSFVGLKLSNVKCYSDDDLWCMDRGLGLFAGLNVLPKSAL